MVAGCYQSNYHGLQHHLDSAGLDPWNNHWAEVYDFTPTPGEQHWRLAGRLFRVEDYLKVNNFAKVFPGLCKLSIPEGTC